MPRDLIVNGDIVLYGSVGASFWGEEWFTATDVLHALARVEGDVTIRLNSGGGVAWDGIAIFNALKARPDKVTVVIDGVAASAASTVAMGGDEIVMRSGALLMIHNASAETWGTKEDHEKSSALLQRLDAQMTAIYADRAEADPEEVRAWMAAETWMDGADALAKGFATSTDEKKAARATAFDWRVYSRAPKPLMAAARRLPPRNPNSSAAFAAAQPEVSMTSQTPAAPKAAQTEATPTSAEITAAATAAVAADRERRKSVKALASAKGREALAEHLCDATAMSVEDIDAALQAAPGASASASPEAAVDYAAARTAGLSAPAGAQAAPPARAAWDKVVERQNARRA